LGDQLMTLQVGDEYFAVDIQAVAEIRQWESLTRLPNSAPHVLGVINMRGDVVPLIDMRILLGVGEATYLPTTVVLVLTGKRSNGKRTLGFVVDSVHDVIPFEGSRVQSKAGLLNAIPHALATGLIDHADFTLTILCVERLLDLEMEGS